MRRASLISTVTIVAFLFAGVAHPAFAQAPLAPQSAPAPSPLRASIDRAAEQAAQFPNVPARRAGEVRKQMSGGGGGGGMMMMTLLITAASLVGTYFLVKELKKSTDEATKAQ